MFNDLEVICLSLPEDMQKLHVYALGDVHVGSQQFDEQAVRKKIKIIQDDPCGVVCLCGDLGDYGLKNSKTNVYRATMSPKAQQEYIYDLFLPIANKIAAAVPGNHEERIMKEVGMCPLYDLCVRWGISERYRENLAITKYTFGLWPAQKQQIVFVGITTHGSTRNKHKKFIACFDGIDFAISGHTHTPEYSPHGKVRVNSLAGTASLVPYKEIVVDANLSVGGYGLKNEYEISAPPELQYLELSGYRGTGQTRAKQKVMNYHTIQI